MSSAFGGYEFQEDPEELKEQRASEVKFAKMCYEVKHSRGWASALKIIEGRIAEEQRLFLNGSTDPVEAKGRLNGIYGLLEEIEQQSAVYVQYLEELEEEDDDE